MRSRLAIVFFVLALCCTSASYAAIGWANYQWPCMGAGYADNQNIDIYSRVWKGGCTDPGGPCLDISATIYYHRASEGATWHSGTMTYLGDDFNNDEHTFQIPASATEAGDPLEYYIVWHDASDNSDFNPSDHCGGGNVPPMVLNITPATEREVTVFFYVDVNCLPEELTYNMFVAGDFQGWSACNPGNQMTPVGSRLYVGNLSFAAGSNPYHEFKFNRFGTDSCQWENSIGNRSFVIDDSGPEMHLPVVRWDNYACCLPGGPAEITGPGTFCVRLCLCENYLHIPLNTNVSPPLLGGVTFASGCNQGGVCQEDCTPGAGEVWWNVVGAEGAWVLVLCITPGDGAHEGCFCMTIDQILPVEFGTFSALPGNGEVTLNWNTLSENNNARFDIERDGNLLAQVASLGNSASGHRYSFTDREVQNGTTYSYKLFSVDLNGAREELATTEATPSANAIASEYRLEQNYPNPFNPSTSISYSIPEAGLVTLSVFDLNGREVAQLVNRSQSAGSYSVDFNGESLSSGIYYYRLTANSFTATHKMVLMK